MNRVQVGEMSSVQVGDAVGFRSEMSKVQVRDE